MKKGIYKNIQLGMVEPHANLLTTPSEEQSIYKVMSAENFLKSFSGSYLHFNRVDRYKDFSVSDVQDGEQPPKDRLVNEVSFFRESPSFTLSDYYDRCRRRTYACCFSLENSDYMWKNYGTGGAKGKICIEFNFGLLRITLNRTLDPVNTRFIYNGQECHQIFSVNYGSIEYVELDTVQLNKHYLQNPIMYTYIKDLKNFKEERELRVSLSALGIGQFALKDGSYIEFPDFLPIPFNFQQAIQEGSIRHLLCSSDCDTDHLTFEIHKQGIDDIFQLERRDAE